MSRAHARLAGNFGDDMSSLTFAARSTDLGGPCESTAFDAHALTVPHNAERIQGGATPLLVPDTVDRAADDAHSITRLDGTINGAMSSLTFGARSTDRGDPTKDDVMGVRANAVLPSAGSAQQEASPFGKRILVCVIVAVAPEDTQRLGSVGVDVHTVHSFGQATTSKGVLMQIKTMLRQGRVIWLHGQIQKAALGEVDMDHTDLSFGTSGRDTVDDPILGQAMVLHTFRAAAASQIRPGIYAAGGTGHLDGLGHCGPRGTESR